ncbi:hypothetical protein [Allorhodopirellula heiligendammensis]|uniref:Uncharacterized protein n=1 Tax=Allorhodopirellula heiligendammensis TaxID=2714739 RepID=A0A5C6C1I9_9BACT|nr:hypothetical protein [Allorhodopirellula heiligendammensis]TWU18002.1 hypothetical protein Poly21_01550 [Allorhodopirellula heiligendammensis]
MSDGRQCDPLSYCFVFQLYLIMLKLCGVLTLTWAGTLAFTWVPLAIAIVINIVSSTFHRIW